MMTSNDVFKGGCHTHVILIQTWGTWCVDCGDDDDNINLGNSVSNVHYSVKSGSSLGKTSGTQSAIIKAEEERTALPAQFAALGEQGQLPMEAEPAASTAKLNVLHTSDTRNEFISKKVGASDALNLMATCGFKMNTATEQRTDSCSSTELIITSSQRHSCFWWRYQTFNKAFKKQHTRNK